MAAPQYVVIKACRAVPVRRPLVIDPGQAAARLFLIGRYRRWGRSRPPASATPDLPLLEEGFWAICARFALLCACAGRPGRGCDPEIRDDHERQQCMRISAVISLLRRARQLQAAVALSFFAQNRLPCRNRLGSPRRQRFLHSGAPDHCSALLMTMVARPAGATPGQTTAATRRGGSTPEQDVHHRLPVKRCHPVTRLIQRG